MKTLGKKATTDFIRLISLMEGNQYLRIENSPYMPLTMERIGEDIVTQFGNACLYSLCHYYLQNGDLMQDPEMCFVVVDKRENDSDTWDKVTVIPYMFQQAILGLYHESIAIEQSGLRMVNVKLQSADAEFAGIWLDNIRIQGYLNPACRKTRR